MRPVSGAGRAPGGGGVGERGRGADLPPAGAADGGGREGRRQPVRPKALDLRMEVATECARLRGAAGYRGAPCPIIAPSLMGGDHEGMQGVTDQRGRGVSL